MVPKRIVEPGGIFLSPLPHDAHVGGADDLVHAHQLLDPVGAPAHDPGDGEQGGVELHGDAQQVIEEPAVQVDVGADPLEDGPVVGDELGGLHLNVPVEGQVILAALLQGQLVDEGAENLLPGVGDGVDRVAHAVDEAAVVKGLLIEDFRR